MNPISQNETDAQARQWLVHLMSGTATTDDGEAFRAWCEANDSHALAFAHARHLWRDLGPAIAQHRPSNGSSRKPARHGVRLGRRAFITSAVTASLAAVVWNRYGTGIFGPGSSNASTLSTAVGEQRTVAVADGVSLEMNTATDIGLRFSGNIVSGIVLDRGEAVVRIDSSRRAPFDVDLESATVSSEPGAAFAIRAVDDAFAVTCLDGQTILHRDSINTLVKPSQQVNFNQHGTSDAVAVNRDTAFAWRQRVLIYDNQTLADMVTDINRYRPGRIIITNTALASRRVHARFTLDQMADVATLIQDAYSAHVTHLPGDWVLLS